MKLIDVIEIRPSRCQPAIRAELAALVPPVERYGGLYFETLHGDPRMERLFEVIRRHDLKPYRPPHYQEPYNYSFYIRREFEPSDFVGIRYVKLHVSTSMDRITGPGKWQQELALTGKWVRRNRRDVFASEYRRLYVRDRVKRLFEQAGIGGISYLPTRVYGPGPASPEQIEELGGGWWGTQVEKTCPKRLPDEPTDLPIIGFLQRYRESDLAAVEPFDLAFVHPEDGAASFYESLIISRRLYQLCQRYKLSAEYEPVYLVD